MKFFEMAQKQPWFKNTVFVIVADHCSSSAGKTELPMDKYRIPAMIYAPEFVAPQKFLTSYFSDRCDAYRFGIIELQISI